MASQHDSGRTVVAVEIQTEPGSEGGRSVAPVARAPRTFRRGPLRGWRRAWERRDLLFVGVVATWVAFDQITKAIVQATLEPGEHWELAPFFRFSHITNSGAAFGLFSDMNLLLAVSSVIAVVVLVVYSFAPAVDHWLARLGLALILAGALGNMLDRIYQGNVTDFINFKHFPAFNVADTGINLGVAAVLLCLIVEDAARSRGQR